MSDNMQSLRRKIDGAGDLEGVVRAMKALAASSIGQYERAVQSLDGYYRTVELGLSACLRQARPAQVTKVKLPKAEAPVGAVIFGSDQGLVGRFNEVIVDLAVDTLKKLPGHKRKIWAVGDRVHGLLVDAGLGAPNRLSVPSSVNAITPLVGEILIEIEAAREQHDVVEVYLFHNHPKSADVFEPVYKRCCRSTKRGKATLPSCRGPRRCFLRSSKVRPLHWKLLSGATCLSSSFKRVRSPSTARTPAVWRPCNAPKKTSRTCSKT